MTLEQFISQQPPDRVAKIRSGDRAEAEALAKEFNAASAPQADEAPQADAAPQPPAQSFTKDELPQYLSSLERINPVLHSRIRRGDAAAAQEALDFDARNFSRFQTEGLSKIGENDLDYFRWAKARGFTKNDESIVTSFGRALWNLAKGGASFVRTSVEAGIGNTGKAVELAATVVDGAQSNFSDSKMLGAGIAKMVTGSGDGQNDSTLDDAAEFELVRFANEENAKQNEWRRKIGGDAFAAIPVDPNAAQFIGEIALAPDNLIGAGLGRAVVKRGLEKGLISEVAGKALTKEMSILPKPKIVPLVGQSKVLSEASLAAREELTGLEAKLASARLTMQAMPEADRAAQLADIVKPLEEQVAKSRANFQQLYGQLEANRNAVTAELDQLGTSLTDRAGGGSAKLVGSAIEATGQKMSDAWRAVRGVADGEGDQLVDTLADQATGGATAVARQGNLVTKVGRDLKVVGELYAQGEASLPFFSRLRQAKQASRMTRAAGALIDESKLGYLGGKASEFAKAGAAGVPVSAAFGYFASGGDVNAAAESGGFGFGMGLAGGAYGEWETFRDPQVRVDELLGNRRNFRQWLIDSGDKQGQLQLFDSLDPENQIAIASYAHAQPDVAFVFERAGKNGPAGFYDRERNVITLNVESPDALSKTFAHEISHYVERHGLTNQVRDAFLGNAETGQLGEFTKVGPDGKPVVKESAQPDGTTRKEYELNDAGLELKRQYEERARQTISPDFVLTPEAFASELFAEQYADQLISGQFLNDLKGSPIDAIANTALVKGVLGKIGVSFDQNDKVIGTGLFGRLNANKSVSSLIREYNRQTARGKRGEMSDDVDFELSEEALKNSELAVKWLQAGGAVKFDADGKPVYKGDRPQFLTSKEAEQVQRDLANELIKEIDAWVAANPDNPDAVQKRSDGLYAGSYIPPEIIDKIEAQRKFNPYQLATLRAASQVMKENGPGSILAHFYQAASKKGSSGYKTVGGRWRKDAIYGIRITKDANVLLQSFSWEQLFENARKASKTKRARELWGTSGEALDTAIVGDVVQYLRNLEGGEPGATMLGEDKKNFINNLLGIRMAANEGVNPEFNVTAAPKTIITSLRLDRMNRLTPLDTVEYAWGVDQYQRAKNNFTPGSGKRTKSPAIEGAEVMADDGDAQYSPGTLLDEKGNPLTLKHGSPLSNLTELKPKDGVIYLTDNADVAEGYTAPRGLWSGAKTGKVYDFNASMQNPLEIDALGKRNDNIPVPWQEWKPKVFGNLPPNAVSVEAAARYAKENGYDGLIVRNVVDSADVTDKTKSNVYAVFSADQLRPVAATDNVGTFDPKNPDIRFSPGSATIDQVGDQTYEGVLLKDRYADQKYDEAIPLTFAVDKKGNVVFSKDGPKITTRQYDFYDSPVVAELGIDPEVLASLKTKLNVATLGQIKGGYLSSLEPAERDALDKMVDAYSSRAVDDFARYAKDPEVKAAAGWYSEIAEFFKRLMPNAGDRTMFLEFLGGTSPNTSVEQNFLYALDLFNRWKKGELNQHLDAYRRVRDTFEQLAAPYAERVPVLLESGKQKTALGEPVFEWKLKEGAESQFRKDFYKALVSDGVKPDAAKKRAAQFSEANLVALLQIQNGVIPRRVGGGKYGVHTGRILQILDGVWRSVTDAPKAPNFTENLAGISTRATIDVWAARWLRRIGHDGLSKQPWRIVPMMEQGVGNSDFFLGQEIFEETTRRINDRFSGDLGRSIQPDDLQAIMWFAEKREWKSRGWAKFEDLGDFRQYTNKLTAQPDGTFTLRGVTLNSTSTDFLSTLAGVEIVGGTLQAQRRNAWRELVASARKMRDSVAGDKLDEKGIAAATEKFLAAYEQLGQQFNSREQP